jgi:mycothiol synthase
MKMTPPGPPPEKYPDAALTLRLARWDDLNAVAQLICDLCAAEGDTSVATTPDDLANDWKSPGFAPEKDAFVVESRAGQLAGYAALFASAGHCDLGVDFNIHPQFKSPGIYSTLLNALENRASGHLQLAAPEARVFIRTALNTRGEVGKAAFAAEGYTPVRYQWRMGIELASEPLPPALPGGLEFRSFVKDDQAQAVWQASNEAFRDHWGSRDLTFAEFSHATLQSPKYDPTLWLVVWYGKEVAGFSLNKYRMGIGWISHLGVRPAWRKKGVGSAILQQSFVEFYRRGTRTIGLGVDASNPTGATRLYLKAGMHTVSEFVVFEKELRPGI